MLAYAMTGRDGLRHDVRLPKGPFRFVGVDVETASRDVGSICQIGLALVSDDGGICTWSTLVDPGVPFARGNIRVHGIRPEDVAGAPAFGAVMEAIRPVMERHPLVQHSRFDQRAFEAACRACGVPAPDSEWNDSVRIARRAWPELKRPAGTGHGLASLKRALGLRFVHHDAGEDARAAAQVVLAAEARLGPLRHLHRKAVQMELPLV